MIIRTTGTPKKQNSNLFKLFNKKLSIKFFFNKKVRTGFRTPEHFLTNTFGLANQRFKYLNTSLNLLKNRNN